MTQQPQLQLATAGSSACRLRLSPQGASSSATAHYPLCGGDNTSCPLCGASACLHAALRCELVQPLIMAIAGLICTRGLAKTMAAQLTFPAITDCRARGLKINDMGGKSRSELVEAYGQMPDRVVKASTILYRDLLNT